MANKRILDDFIGDFELDRKEGVSVVSTVDLAQLKSLGCSIEDLLKRLCRRHHSLLHGSRACIPEGYLKPNEVGKVFASDLAAIALMRAILSNLNLTDDGLEYSYYLGMLSTLSVNIHGIKEYTIGNSGYVYVINQRSGFKNRPFWSWQYIKKGQNVPFAARIAVERSDFTYPIYDVTNNKRIQ